MLEAKRRIGLFLTLGVILAMTAAWLTYGRVSAVEQQLGKRVPIYIAASVIPAQLPLVEAALTTTYIPASFLQPDMVTDPADFTGKVSLVPLRPGQMLTRPMLSTRFVVPKEYRVLRLYRSQTMAFDDNLLAGDRLDVMVTIGDPEHRERALSTDALYRALPLVESDPKGEWVGILVEERNVAKIINFQNSGYKIQLLRVNPA